MGWQRRFSNPRVDAAGSQEHIKYDIIPTDIDNSFPEFDVDLFSDEILQGDEDD